MKVKIIRDINNEELESLFVEGNVIDGREYEISSYGVAGDIVIYGEYGCEYDIYNGEYEVV